mgnify:CR=1 FL=1
MRLILFLSILFFLFSFWLSGCVLAESTGVPPAIPSATVSSSENQLDNPTASPDSEIPSPTAVDIPFEPVSLSAPDCNYGGSFKSIEAVDRLTVRFTLCAPDPAFLEKIAFPSFAIQPDEWLKETGGGGRLLENPVGTGPYRLVEWKRGQELVLEGFDGYWGEPKASISPLIFRWESIAQQRLLQVMAGMVDGAESIGPEYFEQVSSYAGLNLLIRPALNVAYLGINNTIPPFDQEEVRRALAMAIDRNRLVQVAYPTGYQLAEYFGPCTIPFGCEGEAWYAFDAQAARDLLSQAGFPMGFQVSLMYRGEAYGYMPWPDRVAAEISRQLKQNLGLDVQLSVVESDDFLSAVDSGQIPGLFLLGWGADYPDISNFLDTHFGVDAPATFGRHFPDIEEALHAGSNSSAENRAPFYAQANTAIKSHVPMIPLAHGGWDSQESLSVVYRQGFQGANTTFYGYEAFHLLTYPGQEGFVWLQPVEPQSLFCADEADPSAFQACTQVTESLYRLEPGGVIAQPNLAENCAVDTSLTVWTCSLRSGIEFHNGAFLDANDVATSFIIQWDALHPLHKGNTGAFAYFRLFWGNFLNAT